MSRKITVNDSNYLKSFGIYGPITTPMACSDATIRTLLNGGHKVYEVKPDGTSVRLTLADLDSNTTTAAVASKPAPKKVATETVVETTAEVDEGKVFNGVSATTAATVPEVESEPSQTTMSKSQKKAQKKAKYEAKKEAEKEAETEAKVEETAEVAE